MTDGAYAAKIERDIREAVRDGVNATPKFYVDGERIDGKLPLDGSRGRDPGRGAGGLRGLTVPGPHRSTRRCIRRRTELNRAAVARVAAATATAPRNPST